MLNLKPKFCTIIVDTTIYVKIIITYFFMLFS
jgi:hypothetical protein